jgi:hypothetical protein
MIRQYARLYSSSCVCGSMKILVNLGEAICRRDIGVKSLSETKTFRLVNKDRKEKHVGEGHAKACVAERSAYVTSRDTLSG